MVIMTEKSPNPKSYKTKNGNKLRKSRKQINDDIVLEKFRQTQRLKKLVNAENNEGPDNEEEEKEDINAVVEERLPTNEELAANQISTKEREEADQVLDEVNHLQKIDRKKIAKEKKKFKLQQRRQQQKESQTDLETTSETKQEKALAYLKQWKKNRDDWKFKKNIHIWLLKNWKHSNKVSDKKFKRFLKYVKSIDSNSSALKRLENDAKKIVESPDSNELLMARAREILQWID